MPIRALVFDLDGTIVDTESPIFAAWTRIYHAHGEELPRELWCTRIGTDGAGFDPLQHLEERLGRPVDREAIQAQRMRHRDTLMAQMGPRPGIPELVAAAVADGLALAAASSSPESWVSERLEHAGLRGSFSVLRCREHVARVKPDPALFREAVRALGVAPEEAIAIEDSPNGVSAAVEAGLYTVAVPGPMTLDLDFSRAHLQVATLSEAPYETLVARAEAARPWCEGKRRRRAQRTK
jgi:HAD superfamily hydrolase (TIGR01509 family)